MLKKMIFIGLLLTVLVFSVSANEGGLNQQSRIVNITGDLTTIYTLGNASDEMKIPDATAVGAYFSSMTVPASKNGYFTSANIHISIKPTDWIESYFKLYAIDRPGSMYLPLMLEPNSSKSLTNDMSLDSVFGRVSILQALEIDTEYDLFLKAGRYKAQASHFGHISKYYTEQLLYLQNTKTDLTYELGIANDLFSVSAATNYLFNESTQRYFDEDDMLDHGNLALNEYKPQLIVMAKLTEMKFGDNELNAEVLYGYNVAGIYSGHSAGFSLCYSINNETNGLSIPIGLTFIFYEKNIDLLARAAVTPSTLVGKGSMSFRNTFGAGLAAGIRYEQEQYEFDFNLAGTFSLIKHYYRNDLPLIKLSADSMFTLSKNFFVGGGFIAGTLLDTEWKTRDEEGASSKEDFFHTFTFAANMGYEVYCGINFRDYGRFVIGFNQNKGLSLNHMLEAKPEGQMKYKQADTAWTISDRLVEAGGLYFKCVFRF